MKIVWQPLWRLLLSLGIVAQLIGSCGSLGGTETGNPGVSALDQLDPQDFPPGTEAGYLLDAICAKLNPCTPQLTLVACAQGILAVSTIDEEIGLTAGSYPTFLATMEAEAMGDITPDLTQTRSCRTEIAMLPCSSAEVQGAYNPDQPDEFSTVEQIFSDQTPSCAHYY